MKHRTIGGVDVSVIGLGCMGMSEFYGASDRKQSIEVIQHALDIGVNLLDTADMYGTGHNEELVGEAIRGRRGEAFVSTVAASTCGSRRKAASRGSAST